jgi:hypothetical protein
VSGFIAESVGEMIAAVHKIEGLSRQRCREEFESRFTVEVMVDQYERVFRRLVEEGRGKSLVRSMRGAKTHPNELRTFAG